MELMIVWQFVRRRWWIMLLPAFIALIVTLPLFAEVVSPPVSYWVQLRLTAAAPPNADSIGNDAPYEDSVYVPLLASEYVVVNMPGWITSDSFASEVGKKLNETGLEISGDDLAGAFNADGYRSIMTLYVVWDDAAEIQSIAEAAVDVLQTRNQAYFPQFAAEPVQVVSLDKIEVVEIAPPIMSRLEPLIRVAMGFLFGVVLAILAEYLDRSVRTRDEVESLGLPVVAEIPRE